MRRFRSWLWCYTVAVRHGWHTFCFIRRHELTHLAWETVMNRAMDARINDLLRESGIATPSADPYGPFTSKGDTK